MINNLQAGSLSGVNSSILVSKKFKIPKKIPLNRWLKLDTKELKLTLYKDNCAIAKAKLSSKEGYFFIELKKSSKKVEQKIKKDEAILQIEYRKSLNNGSYIFAKMPLSALLKGDKIYQVEIYYNNAFYIEIKDIL